ncbi:MAG: alpha/beta hydrolase [Pseudomonadota bacterium]
MDESVKTPAGNVAAGAAGAGPPLVLAHGWPWSSYAWHRVIPALAKDFRVHWYDMPGYGQSDKFDGQRSSLDVQGEIFALMLEHWRLERPRVIAHDFGGATALRAHLLHGCQYERLVLLNVVAMRPWGSEFFDHVGRYVDAFQGLPPPIHEAVVRAYIKGAVARTADPGDLDALAAPWLTPEGHKSFYRQFAQADERYTAEVEPMYGAVVCPTLIVWGEDDPWIPLARGRALHQRMKNALFDTLLGVGHLPQLEEPVGLLAKTRDFLRP